METLRDIRTRRLFSLRGLAEAAGVSQVTIQNVEAGRHSPHPGTIRKLAAALGVEPGEVAEFSAAIEAARRGRGMRTADRIGPESRGKRAA
jgi:transcriptional regulator with XRE-family HTH domain